MENMYIIAQNDRIHKIRNRQIILYFKELKSDLFVGYLVH